MTTTTTSGAVAKPFEDPAPPFNKWRGEMQAALKSSGIYAARSPGTGNKLTLRWRETRKAVQPAHQWDVGYPQLPEPDIAVCNDGKAWIFTNKDVVGEPDAASHGKAPAQAASSAVLKAIREANMQLVRTGDDAFMLVPYKAVTAQAADSVTAPAPPPECETEAEKRAFAFGWFKALESERMKAESVQEDAARYRLLRRCKGQEHEPPFTVQHEIDGTLWGGDLDAAIDAVRKQGATT